MAPTKTRTVKNKHSAASKGGKGGGKGGPSGGKRSETDGVSKSRGSQSGPKKTPQSQQLKEKNRAALLRKPKRRKYTEAELGIPKLNTITPVGVIKPPGKKKGKVFVDDQESMNTILSLVQAEKDGHIESKMIKARQLEEIREARKVEAEKKEGERRARIDDTKQSLRKKRKRTSDGPGENVNGFSAAGTKAAKPKKKVAFA